MAKSKGGRPGFDISIREDLLRLIAEGKSLRKACKQKDMPSISTVMKWLSEDVKFSEQYAHAREERALFHFEECLDIADNADPDLIAKAKLRIDTRKWMVGKMSPKKYGEKLDLTSSDGSMTPQPLPWNEMYPDRSKGDSNA